MRKRKIAVTVIMSCALALAVGWAMMPKETPEQGDYEQSNQTNDRKGLEKIDPVDRQKLLRQPDSIYIDPDKIKGSP